MGTSKKQRGKQRKAAKQAAATNNEQVELCQNHPATTITTENEPATSSDSELEAFVSERYAQLVSMGDHKATAVLCAIPKEERSMTPIVKSGILSTVLSFIKRCRTDTFDNVVLTAYAAHSGTVGFSGTLESPIYWIGILRVAVKQEDDCSSELIAENIGPLVRCMCNDTERLFFKSNKHWMEGIATFSGLISDMIIKLAESTDKKVMNTLLKHEGLLSSIIQWGLWDNDRPDISKELKDGHINGELSVDACVQIVSVGRVTVANLVESVYQMKDGKRLITTEGRGLLKTIGSTPIVNQDYDPTCMVSYVEGLIRAVKKEGWERNGLNIISHLIAETDCIDKGVITEMIDLGANYRHNVESAELVTKFAARMIRIEISEEKSQPNDTRTAFAIRAGLFEMCFGFIESFYRHSSITFDDGLFHFIGRVFFIVHEVVLHQKTAKAIRSKRIMIEEKLVCLEQNTDITSYTECRDILGMVKSILGLSGSYCCRCNKSLSKTEIMECSGCGRMMYCSRSCQREDWLNGHNVTCGKSYTADLAGQFQGRIIETVSNDERDATKIEDLEINMSMIQLKLFLDNSETILAQVKSLNLNFCDCLVVFDICNCPIEVEVKNYTDVFERPDLQKGFEESRSMDNITCLYYSSIYSGNRKGYVARQRLFPHEWLKKQSK